MLSCSVFYIKQKVELKKFNCFFAGFLKQSFLRMKVIQTVVESEYTPDRRRQICFPYQVYTRQKATDLISIPSIHQTEGDRFDFHTKYTPDRRRQICFPYQTEGDRFSFHTKDCVQILFQTFFKFFSCQYGGPPIHLLRTLPLYNSMIYRKKK